MGLHYQLSADYLLSKHVGIGVNAGMIYGNVYDKDGVIPGSMDQSVEFYRIFINGGLHFYFKRNPAANAQPTEFLSSFATSNINSMN